MQKITSRDNEKIKHALRVRGGREPGEIFIEGKRLAAEAFGSGLRLEYAFIASDLLAREGEDELKQALAGSGTPVYELPNKLLASISDTESPQGIILIGQRPIAQLSEALVAENRSGLPVVLLLSRVNNPANLGAILRTAEASGVRTVITSAGSADAFSPKALRASMGSAFRLRVVEKADAHEVIADARRAGFRVSGSTADGAAAHTAIDWTKKRLLIFGSEASGISAELEGELDERIAIEMEKPVESLNLAVSTGVILFEARRQVYG